MVMPQPTCTTHGDVANCPTGAACPGILHPAPDASITENPALAASAAVVLPRSFPSRGLSVPALHVTAPRDRAVAAFGDLVDAIVALVRK